VQPPASDHRPTFRARHRLSRDRDYQRVYDARVRTGRGPLLVFARPNDLPWSRLGLSVGRRVGKAVARNRIKRRLREAFRLLRPHCPAGYDLVVHVRPHEPLREPEYRRLLESAWKKLDATWRRRRESEAASNSSPDAPS